MSASPLLPLSMPPRIRPGHRSCAILPVHPHHLEPELPGAQGRQPPWVPMAASSPPPLTLLAKEEAEGLAGVPLAGVPLAGLHIKVPGFPHHHSGNFELSKTGACFGCNRLFLIA